jgi:hypothetical protein
MLTAVKELSLDYCSEITDLSALAKVEILSVIGLSKISKPLPPQHNQLKTLICCDSSIELMNLPAYEKARKQKIKLIIFKDFTNLLLLNGFLDVTFEENKQLTVIKGLKLLQKLTCRKCSNLKSISSLSSVREILCENLSRFPKIDFLTLPFLEHLLFTNILDSEKKGLLIPTKLSSLMLENCSIAEITILAEIKILKINKLKESCEILLRHGMIENIIFDYSNQLSIRR